MEAEAKEKKRQKRENEDNCPECLEELMENICKLVGEEDMPECQRRFLEESPEDFVKWLKSKNITEEEFMEAIGEKPEEKQAEKAG
jgi:hypothetical protein